MGCVRCRKSLLSKYSQPLKLEKSSPSEEREDLQGSRIGTFLKNNRICFKKRNGIWVCQIQPKDDKFDSGATYSSLSDQWIAHLVCREVDLRFPKRARMTGKILAEKTDWKLASHDQQGLKKEAFLLIVTDMDNRRRWCCSMGKIGISE